MNKVFVTADTHFGHSNIIDFEHEFRPFASIEAHDKEIIARWNAVVQLDDTVWHLGDVFFGKNGHWPLAQLNGYKRLVLGNHDHYPLEVYQQYFNAIHGAAERKHCLLTHVPVHPGQFHRYAKNIHGHLHHLEIADDSRYVCVSMERTGLAPVLMDSLL